MCGRIFIDNYSFMCIFPISNRVYTYDITYQCLGEFLSVIFLLITLQPYLSVAKAKITHLV